MRIATYNIWNSETLHARTEDLLREIRMANADVIGLQEAPRAFFEAAAQLYPHAIYEQYDGEDEGLALLSKFPILQSEWLHGKAVALHALVDADGARISITNVHLPWQSILMREAQIVYINAFANGIQADRYVLLGDFNGAADSVHGFLTGLNSLNRCESDPVWLDVAQNFALLHGMEFLPTLDTIGNPRWKGQNTVYAPKAMDRIYVRDSGNAFSFDDARVFGTAVSRTTGFCPSDHYGVLADITFA